MKTKIRHPEKVNKPINPIKSKPHWIRSRLSNSQEFFLTKTVSYVLAVNGRIISRMTPPKDMTPLCIFQTRSLLSRIGMVKSQ